MVQTSELTERITPFADADETIIGAVRMMRGPRPGTEALALVVNVPLLVFSPAGIGATLLIGLAIAALVLLVIAALRQYLICAVTDRGVVLLNCGRVPTRWVPRALEQRLGWALLDDADRHRGPRATINDQPYWIMASDQAEARRLDRWMATQT
jgi:hypothetical protein